MGLKDVKSMCIAGFGLATAALGGCASTGHEVPYTGDTFPTFHGAYNQSASSPYSTLSFADSMLDHFFRMNPAGSPGRLELARLVRQNTVDVYVPTAQFYTNDRGEITRQSIRRASVWNPDTQEPLKITREGGFYILAHQSNDENLDGFPAFAALTEGRHVQPAAQMRLSKPYEMQKCETTGRAALERNEQRLGSLESITPREAFSILAAQTAMAYYTVERYAEDYYIRNSLPQDLNIAANIIEYTRPYSCVKEPGSRYRVRDGVVSSMNEYNPRRHTPYGTREQQTDMYYSYNVSIAYGAQPPAPSRP